MSSVKIVWALRPDDPVGDPYVTSAHVYDAQKRLVSAGGASDAALIWDPTGRLFRTAYGGEPTTRFLHDGEALVGEYNNELR